MREEITETGALKQPGQRRIARQARLLPDRTRQVA
jgi:hypothetical protein